MATVTGIRMWTPVGTSFDPLHTPAAGIKNVRALKWQHLRGQADLQLTLTLFSKRSHPSPHELDSDLKEWLDAAGDPLGCARAIITPHAGYSYCGATAAYAFKQTDPSNIRRIFVLGPSHKVSLEGCALTTCDKYSTPLGDLNIDREITDELYATGQFEWMDRDYEESEHSLEMQLPFIVKIFERKSPTSFTVIPILVGSGDQQATYGSILARYIADPHALFVISSDFCHWGSRFRFSPHMDSSPTAAPFHEQIRALDKQGMDAIETLNPSSFSEYLKRTQNTICGRNPILVMLHAAEHFRMANNHTHEFRFLRYSQSNQVRTVNDSSVSYAAGALFIHPK